LYNQNISGLKTANIVHIAHAKLLAIASFVTIPNQDIIRRQTLVFLHLEKVIINCTKSETKKNESEESPLKKAIKNLTFAYY